MKELKPIQPPWISSPGVWVKMNHEKKAASIMRHLHLLQLTWQEAYDRAEEYTNRILADAQPAAAPLSNLDERYIDAMEEAYDAMLSSWSILSQPSLNQGRFKDVVDSLSLSLKNLTSLLAEHKAH